MNRQYLTLGIISAAVLLLVGLGVLLYGLSQETTGPGPAETAAPTPQEPVFGSVTPVKPEPPQSLTELADELRPDYPELADLLENPELSSVYKDFYLAYQNGGEPAARALAQQRGILNDNDEIVMTLVLDTEDSEALAAELEAEGVIVTGRFRNLINIAIPVALIEQKAETESPSAIIERISNLDNVIRLEFPHKATSFQSILGQGVNATFAGNWHALGITGQGVKVGVLDLGFGGYQDLLNRELPPNVTVELFGSDEYFSDEVHGTACAEIVHEMAPDAELYLAYYDGTDLTFGLAATWLMSQGVDIISNSTGSNGLSPLDGTGFSAEIADEAHAAGIFWVNAAGNEATSHYRGRFQDDDDNDIHEFFPEVEVIPFIPYGPGYETSIILSWDDWTNVDQDYDLFLTNEAGDILGVSADYQTGQAGAVPVEGFFYEFDDSEIYYLSIENSQGQARGDATFDLFIEDGEFHPDYLVPAYSLSTPADARGAFAVGAVHWADDILESYSSQGPTTDGRLKPDIVAPSVVDSASYSPEAFNGTSAAAPHVAGAAALALQALPELAGRPDALAQFLVERAKDLGEPGPDTEFGAGVLKLGAAPDNSAAPEEPPVPLAEVQATSTPRPAPQVGLPSRVGLPEPSAPASTSSGAGALSLIVITGLCLMCLAGLLFVGLILGGIILAWRKKR